MLPSFCSNQQYECISLSLNISVTTSQRAPRARVHRAGERAGPALILHAARLPCSNLSTRAALIAREAARVVPAAAAAPVAAASPAARTALQ